MEISDSLHHNTTEQITFNCVFLECLSLKIFNEFHKSFIAGILVMAGWGRGWSPSVDFLQSAGPSAGGARKGSRITTMIVIKSLQVSSDCGWSEGPIIIKY